MKRVYVVAGLPGSGKSHYIENDPVLSKCPKIDAADVRRERPDAYYVDVVNDIALLLQEASQTSEIVVIEGMFLPSTPSYNLLRERLASLGYTQDERVYIRMETPWKECVSRILNDEKRDDRNMFVCIGLVLKYAQQLKENR